MKTTSQNLLWTARPFPYTWIFPLIIVIAGSAAYSNSFHGAFLFDDHPSIEDNPRIRDFNSPARILSHRRPVADLSFAFNYAVGGLDVRGYHLVNLLIHLSAAVALYGLIRRTIVRNMIPAPLRNAAPFLATSAVVWWTVHPLLTQSVTYIVQRSESLTGFFYVFMLYCLVRSADSRQRRRWYFAGVIACAAGMGTKAVMITAPVMALLYDRSFLSSSIRDALRKRWPCYTAMFLTPLLLWIIGVAPAILSTDKPIATVGFSYKGISPLVYLLTQAGVVLHYLRLSLWPHPLCLDYGWPPVSSFAEVVFPGIIVFGLVCLTVSMWLRHPPLGFPGVWFFLILSPTSSIVPIKDPAFEHRMYLPLAAVLLGVVLGGYIAGRWLVDRLAWTPRRRTIVAWAVFSAITMTLIAGTLSRNRTYASPVTMWHDTATKRSKNDRALYNLGRVYLDQDRFDHAVAAFREALRINPQRAEAQYNIGKAFAAQGRMELAEAAYHNALRINPARAEPLSDLGNILARRGRIDEAIAYYRRAIEANRRYAPAHYNLGSVLLKRGQIDEAIEALRRAVRFSPDTPRTHFALANALREKGLTDEAVRAYRKTLELQPAHPAARKALNDLLTPQSSHEP